MDLKKSIDRFVFHADTDTIAITLWKPDIILNNLTEYIKRTWVSDRFFVPPKHRAKTVSSLLRNVLLIRNLCRKSNVSSKISSETQYSLLMLF